MHLRRLLARSGSALITSFLSFPKNPSYYGTIASSRESSTCGMRVFGLDCATIWRSITCAWGIECLISPPACLIFAKPDLRWLDARRPRRPAFYQLLRRPLVFLFSAYPKACHRTRASDRARTLHLAQNMYPPECEYLTCVTTCIALHPSATRSFTCLATAS